MTSLILLLACGGPVPTEPAPVSTADQVTEAPRTGSARDVTVVDLATARAAGSVPVLVDVRTTGVFADGHVPGALNIPLSDLEGRLGELGPYTGGAVWVICAVGGRSAKASQTLAGAGFQAVNVDGGTRGWIAAGHEVER